MEEVNAGSKYCYLTFEPQIAYFFIKHSSKHEYMFVHHKLEYALQVTSKFINS